MRSISRDDLMVVGRMALRLCAEDRATFTPAGGEDASSSLGGHAGAETVGLAPLAVVRLIRALHNSSDRLPRVVRGQSPTIILAALVTVNDAPVF